MEGSAFQQEEQVAFHGEEAFDFSPLVVVHGEFGFSKKAVVASHDVAVEAFDAWVVVAAAAVAVEDASHDIAVVAFDFSNSVVEQEEV